MVEMIALIAGVISSISVILGALWKVHRLLTELEKKYEEMNNTLKDNTMYILRMSVLSEEMPLVDRIHAGEKYIALGGNGAVKKKVGHLIEEYESREEEHMQ